MKQPDQPFSVQCLAITELNKMKNKAALCGYSSLLVSIAYFFLGRFGLMQLSPLVDAAVGVLGCSGGVMLHVAEPPKK